MKTKKKNHFVRATKTTKKITDLSGPGTLPGDADHLKIVCTILQDQAHGRNDDGTVTAPQMTDVRDTAARLHRDLERFQSRWGEVPDPTYGPAVGTKIPADKTNKKDDDWKPGCEFFEEANDPVSCRGVVTEAIWLKHKFKDGSRDVVTLYSCEAHAAEFMREKGFVRMEPFKRLPSDRHNYPNWPKKNPERKLIQWG